MHCAPFCQSAWHHEQHEDALVLFRVDSGEMQYARSRNTRDSRQPKAHPDSRGIHKRRDPSAITRRYKKIPLRDSANSRHDLV